MKHLKYACASVVLLVLAACGQVETPEAEINGFAPLAVQATKTNSEFAEVRCTGYSCGSPMREPVIRSVTFDEADFPAGSVVEKVTASITFSAAYADEVEYWLISPSGAFVTFVYGGKFSYCNDDYGTRSYTYGCVGAGTYETPITVVFDDNGAKLGPLATPSSGTFKPHSTEGFTGRLAGKAALGTWTLHMASHGEGALNHHNFSLTVDAGPPANTKQNQTITFTSTPPDPATIGGTYTVGATASSGLAVSFASTDTGVCTVSGDTVSFVGAGTCTVRASQAGDSTYNPASQTQSFEVAKQNQTITFTSRVPKNATVGRTYAVSATASSGLPVSFSSTTTGVCTVSGSTVSFVAAGTCTVQAMQAGNETYNAAPSQTQSITVKAGRVKRR